MAKGKGYTVGKVSGNSMAGGPKSAPGPMKFDKPAGSGQPTAMRKALSKKAPRGGATGFAGTVR